MDAKEIAKRLATIVAELEQIQKSLDAAPVKKLKDVEAYAKAGLCLYCDQPLDDGTGIRTIRGIHQRCYKKVERSQYSMQFHEDSGLIGPPAISGRKGDDKAAQLAKRLESEMMSRDAAEMKAKIDAMTKPNKKSPKK
ncbi:hypothetical protein VN12_04080 [Pirellula sp. SH-Sr6A]|uniref:hypothetical protein n=1 Tax=Pirellula sp. SH-Sr6A TaxID=1632865 RepID=UPI00078E0FB1|nr:hypothetical protein [Pirellula sp. SH-Sr6A]AMV31272.1 hypothetical protein VN12_04080 [Pirellula sp. SH-Sr6A]